MGFFFERCLVFQLGDKVRCGSFVGLIAQIVEGGYFVYIDGGLKGDDLNYELLRIDGNEGWRKDE